MSKIAIVAEMTARPGHFEAYRDKMVEHARASRAEPGCLRFDVAIPRKEENKLYLYEIWADRAALDAHASTERLKAHREATRDMVDQSGITLCELYDSGDA